MHENSLKAYREEEISLGKRAFHIYEFLRDNQGFYTDREVQTHLGYDEPNNVRPRITELIKMGIVKEGEPVRCIKTGKTVRRVTAV
jgi:hypothetical protein